jgi:hypothetical protein
MNRAITDPERVAPGATNTTPANQATNQDQVWPHARSLDDLTFEVGGVRLDLSDRPQPHGRAPDPQGR